MKKFMNKRSKVNLFYVIGGYLKVDLICFQYISPLCNYQKLSFHSGYYQNRVILNLLFESLLIFMQTRTLKERAKEVADTVVNVSHIS